MAACKTMKSQIIRGIVGALLLVAAAFAYKEYYALSFFLVLLSLIPLQGCPVCWLVYTCEIADKTKRSKQTAQKPLDSSGAE